MHNPLGHYVKARMDRGSRAEAGAADGNSDPAEYNSPPDQENGT